MFNLKVWGVFHLNKIKKKLRKKVLYVQDKDSEMKEEKMAENMQKSLYILYIFIN